MTSEDKSEPFKKGHAQVDEATVIRKLNNNILWIFFGMTMMCWLDRTSLAFAALQLNRSLGFSEVVYGMGSSIFFLGYSLFQVPSNMVLVRVGAPFWLSTIVVAWGIVATCFALMRTRWQFYLLRLVLGITEAGSFPGMWYHLSLFYSSQDMAVAYSYVTLGGAVSQVVGAPLAAALLSLDGLLGLAGWQWLFVVEGIPTIALGMWMRTHLCESPAKAKFLTPEEREWVQQRVARGSVGVGSAEPEQQMSVSTAVLNWRVWWLALVALMEATVKYGIVYWCPLIIRAMVANPVLPAHPTRELQLAAGDGPVVPSRQALKLPRALLAVAEVTPGGSQLVRPEHARVEGSLLVRGSSRAAASPLANASSALIALLTALPYGSAAAAMLLCARHSQHTGERRWHATGPLALSALSLGCMAVWIDGNSMLAFGALLLATSLWGPAGILSSLPATFLKGSAAATGVALINSIANMGGMIGPALIGAIKHHYDSYTNAIMALSGVTACACILVFYLPLPGFAGMTTRPSPDRPVQKMSTPFDDRPQHVRLSMRGERPNKGAEQH